MKRVFDFTVSLLMLIVLFPFFLIIGIIIYIDAGRPVIFKQERVGKDNELFLIYKFRTMKRETLNVPTAQLENADEVINKSGRFLRKTSLDELPQLLNILKGEMSFVGPRPLIPQEEEIRELRARYNVFSVKPGMTGLAQINGRDNITDEEKALFDKEYIEKQSFLFDMKILFKTVIVVLTGKGFAEGSKDQKR